MSRRAVTNHVGYISVLSTPPIGTCIYELPLARQNPLRVGRVNGRLREYKSGWRGKSNVKSNPSSPLGTQKNFYLSADPNTSKQKQRCNNDEADILHSFLFLKSILQMQCRY